MSKPISLEFVTDVSKIIKGTDDMAGAFDEVKESLTDLAKDGEKSGEKVEKALAETAKSADKAGEKIEKTYDSTFKAGEKDAKSFESKVDAAFDNLGKSAKSAGADVETSTKKAFKEGEAATETFSKEARANLSETTSSFRGDLEDIPQIFQDILGGVVADLGPAGAIGGAIGAIGIGLAVAFAQGEADKVNKMGEAVSSLAQEIFDTGGNINRIDFPKRMREWGFAIQDTREWWELWQDSAKTGFQKIKEQSAKAGTSWTESFAAAQGPMENSKKFLAETADELERLKLAADDPIWRSTQADLKGLNGAEVIEKMNNLKDLRDQAQKNIDIQQAAIDASKAEEAATAGTTEALKRKVTALEAEADAQKASISSQIDYLDGVDDLNQKLAENGATLDRNTKAGRDNERAVLAQADAIEQVAKDALDAGTANDSVTATFNDQKNMLIQQVLPAFKGNQQAAEAYISSILRVPQMTKTAVALTGVDSAIAQLNELQKTRTIPMHLAPDGTAVDNYIRGMNGKKVYIDFAPRGGVAVTN